MPRKSKKNEASIWFWLIVIAVMSVPGINLIMMIYWAFEGDNETRKNYFRAHLLIIAVVLLVVACLVALGFWPEISKWIKGLSHR